VTQVSTPYNFDGDGIVLNLVFGEIEEKLCSKGLGS
jgi:hypothetical protein